MSEEHQLLAAVRANPRDDTVRLAYADWCDENVGTVQCAPYPPGAHGKCARCNGTEVVSNGRAERAELIRLQIKIWREPNAASEEEQRRARDLIIEWGQYWGADEHQWGVGLAWGRGFVSAAQTTVENWDRRAEDLLKRHPLTDVRLVSLMPYWNGGYHTFYYKDRSRPSQSVPPSAVLPDWVMDRLVYGAWTHRAEAVPGRMVCFDSTVFAVTAVTRILTDRWNGLAFYKYGSIDSEG